jgi:hypothetical protein
MARWLTTAVDAAVREVLQAAAQQCFHFLYFLVENCSWEIIGDLMVGWWLFNGWLVVG